VAERPSIQVRILGQDYRIASDGSPGAEEQIEAAASLVDETMQRIRERTGTVDTVHVAVLAALNVANRFVAQQDQAALPGEPIDPERVQALIELVESAAAESSPPA
jgi:cell division protein ZapA (FtsZ GTPase activity inhibitor)